LVRERRKHAENGKVRHRAGNIPEKLRGGSLFDQRGKRNKSGRGKASGADLHFLSVRLKKEEVCASGSGDTLIQDLNLKDRSEKGESAGSTSYSKGGERTRTPLWQPVRLGGSGPEVKRREAKEKKKRGRSTGTG